MLIPAGATLVFIGDSITDTGRDEVGEASPRPEKPALGQGYVNLVHALIGAAAPASLPRIINRGISGNTVRDLQQRWQRDVLDLKPDWLSVMIGINDVWRQFDAPQRHEIHVPRDAFEQTYRELLQRTRPVLQGLVLMTPFLIESNRDDAMRTMMDDYGRIVRRLAGEFDAVFVDTQAAFDAALQEIHPMTVAADRVHPATLGHMILARAFLGAVGWSWT